MNPKLSASLVFAAAWCAISYNTPTVEGYAAYGAFDWAKLLGAVIPALIALLTGDGSGGLLGVLRVVLKALGFVLPEPTPEPAPVPEPDEDRPILNLLRRLIDLFVSEGRFSEANDAMELYKGCCEQVPVEAKK